MPKPERWETKTLGTRYRVRFRQGGIHRSRTFATEPEAAHLCRMIELLGLERALHDLDAEREGLDEMRLDDWAKRHFASMPNVTAGTLTTYRRIYARVWSPHLGHYRLSQLDREVIAGALAAVPGSDKTVRNAWGVLAHMLKVAVQDGHLNRSPALGIKMATRTSHERRELRFLTEEEFWRLLGDTPAHWRPLVTTLAGTGMRWGEAAALLVGDVDLARATVRITKAEKWDASTSTRLVGPPKTAKSRRTVTLPDEVVDVLRPLCEGRKASERLFLPVKGGPLRHNRFYLDVWKKCVASFDDPKPRIHDLRHSHVAWLIAAGAPLPVIQARLGHEKITTTIDTYGGLLPDLQRAAADAAGQVFTRRPPKLD